jgi:hypothetical protein
MILKGENVHKIDATMKIEEIHSKLCQLYEEMKDKNTPIKKLWI